VKETSQLKSQYSVILSILLPREKLAFNDSGASEEDWSRNILGPNYEGDVYRASLNLRM